MTRINHQKNNMVGEAPLFHKQSEGILATVTKWFGCLCGGKDEEKSSSFLNETKLPQREILFHSQPETEQQLPHGEEHSNRFLNFTLKVDSFKNDFTKMNHSICTIEAKLDIMHYYKVAGLSYEIERRQEIITAIKKFELFVLEFCELYGFNKNNEKNELFISVMRKICELNRKIFEEIVSVDKELKYRVINISYILRKIKLSFELPLDLQIEIQIQYLMDLNCRFERDEVSFEYYEKISIKLNELCEKFENCSHSISLNRLFKYMSKINGFLGEYRASCILKPEVNGLNFSFSEM